jgi:hypothetical protein
VTSPAPTEWLRTAFVGVQSELEMKLKLASQSIAHPGTQGSVTEDHWIEILRSYLPGRYQVAGGIIIDSLGARSDQIDVVVFDRHFTPTLLDQRSHRYIPAEAVYAVFESKPQIDKGKLGYASDKAASVRRLHRTSVAITHAGGRHDPRPPFPIVAGILAQRADWSDGLGATFERHLPTGDLTALDCGCALEHGSFDTFDGAMRAAGPEGGLVVFLFRLLAKLQSLGTVPAIDWAAYARILDATRD